MLLHVRLSRRVILAASAAVTALLMLILSFVASRSASAEPVVGLGTAATFAVLGGQAVSNSGDTTISGDLGVSPQAESTITGFPADMPINGSRYAADDAAGAQAALVTAYNDAAGRASSAPLTLLGGEILTSGVYTGTSQDLTGTVVLDGKNNPDSVWIFQSATTLITAPNSVVALVNGASACNVYWQVGSSATLDTNTVFAGSVLALTSITAATNTYVEGRLLARNGAVTLNAATVVLPRCGIGVTTTVTATPTATTTVTDTVTATPTATTTVTDTVTATPTATTTVTAPGTTSTVTAPGTTSTVTAPGTTSTVTAPGTTVTTTAPAAPAGTLTVNGGGAGEGSEQATVTATVLLSVQANGETIAVQTVAPSSSSTRGSGLVFTGEGAGTGSGGLAFTGSADRAMAGTGLLLVALGGLALMLVRRSPTHRRQH